MSSPFSSSFPLLLLLVSFFLLVSLALVRSESDHLSSVLRDPRSSDEHDGVCAGVASSPSCPINCFRADPVCGVDGVTYWCGCPDAACHGVEVVKLGACQVGNGGPGQALLLVHIIWLFFLAFAVLFGLF